MDGGLDRPGNRLSTGAASFKAKLSNLWTKLHARGLADRPGVIASCFLTSRTPLHGMSPASASLTTTTPVPSKTKGLLPVEPSSAPTSALMAQLPPANHVRSCKSTADLRDFDCIEVTGVASHAVLPHSCSDAGGCVVACAQEAWTELRACEERQAWAELQACVDAAAVVPVVRASMPRAASTGGVDAYDRRTPLTHRRPPPRRHVSAFYLCASLSAQVLAGAPNSGGTMKRAPSSPSTATHTALRFCSSHIAGPSSSPFLPRDPSLPTPMISTTRSTRTTSSLTTPGMSTSAPSFITQFKPLLDPTIVAVLNQHSVL